MTRSVHQLKPGYLVLAALATLGSSYFFGYLFFFLRDRFGFGDRENLAVAAMHGLGAVELATDVSSFLASDAAEIAVTPTTFVVDSGRVVAMAEGWARRDYNALAAAASRLVGADAPVASPAGDGLPDHVAGSRARNAA